MPDRLTDERLRQLRDDENLCTNAGERAMAAELLELRARVIEREAERVADGFGIQSLTTENGVATLTTTPTTEQARELVLAMSLACGKMLDDDQAPNYIEFEVSPAGRLGYVVTVRRSCRPTPHSLRRDAEARADEALAQVAELEARLERVTALAVASDDGSEYEHDHGIGDGHDQCPGCWAEDIRKAVSGDA